MRNKPRIVVCGYHDVGYVCLEELIAAGADVRAVFTHADNPAEHIWFRSVRGLALAHGIPVFMSDDINTPDNITLLKNLEPDILFSFYYRQMICPEILTIPPLGAFNMHGSLLPRYRGRVPVNWAIIHGETRTGATLHRMVAKPDAGDIVDQEAVDIAFTDTALDVFHKVTKAAQRIIARMYPAIAEGRAPRIPQDHTRATYFGGRKPADGMIDWQKDAVAIYNLIRAVTHPYPGAFTFRGSQKLFVWWGKPEDGATGMVPGSVVALAPLFIQTGCGLLSLEKVQAEGEPELPGPLFAEKYHLQVGEQLGG